MSKTKKSIEVAEGYYEKLGTIHCGVIKGFKINCGPQQIVILNDGESHLFDTTGIRAQRNGDVVIFSA